MDLVKPPAGSPAAPAPRYPNMVIFPRALREAIPEYGDRALVFDAVTGATDNIPAAIAGLTGASRFAIAPRAQAKFVVHETGRLDGQYAIWMDLDTETMRALGRFLCDLADRAESQQQ